MNKKIAIIMLCFAVFLSGCSVLEGVGDSLDYVDTTTNYINEVSLFADEIQPIAMEVVGSTEKRVELEKRLTDMKMKIQSFNETQPPELASGAHQQLVEYNTSLETGIDTYLTHIENGEVDPKVLEEIGIFKTITEITNILDQIKSLGQ